MIGMTIEFHGDPAELRKKYHAVTDDAIGRNVPKGLLYHVAGPTAHGWRVSDVWESQAAFNTFAEKLMPAIQKHGMPPAEPVVFDVESTFGEQSPAKR